ncbi:hypothetical protein QEZ48_14545 [Aquamicrobium lusatiense]|uniref:hypothetical protein n=1 Tax=Aquamicrobium lusatiense TaxID=89772 RepID=UPI00245421A5|nr:hypothetical protein [Aquamicrobium lusatiense]MDH4992037.1 hypothetical protein [Aquamicrobium lusatiense]
MAQKHNFTPEKLSTWDTAKLRTLHDNAVRQGASDLVEMCERELVHRKPQKAPRLGQDENSENSVVSEYHFVCAKDRGVIGAGPGKFWSGAWVVAETNVKKSIEYGAYLALHETKAETSYRQGKILDYRRGVRDMVDKQNEGIEFLIEETSHPLEWQGGGSGEKGYKWEPLRRRGSSE